MSQTLGLEFVEEELVGRLIEFARAPQPRRTRKTAAQAIESAMENLTRAQQAYITAARAEYDLTGSETGAQVREWKKRKERARERQWAYAAIMLDQVALAVATGLGPEPVSDDEIGTGVDDVTRAALAWLCRRGLARLRRAQEGAR